MLAAIIALALLAGAVGAIYVLLRNMGEEGIEVAAPGSCKSGQCGVRKGAGCRPGEEPGETAELALAEVDDPTQDDAGQTPEPQRRQG
jgi:hypothetical protein